MPVAPGCVVPRPFCLLAIYNSAMYSGNLSRRLQAGHREHQLYGGLLASRDRHGERGAGSDRHGDAHDAEPPQGAAKLDEFGGGFCHG